MLWLTVGHNKFYYLPTVYNDIVVLPACSVAGERSAGDPTADAVPFVYDIDVCHIMCMLNAALNAPATTKNGQNENDE